MGGHMRSPGRCRGIPLWVAGTFVLFSCSKFQSALAPAPPLAADSSAPGPVPDSLLREAIRRGDLIVLATPVEMVSNHGFITPQFQLGAKETWYT